MNNNTKVKQDAISLLTQKDKDYSLWQKMTQQKNKGEKKPSKKEEKKFWNEVHNNLDFKP